MPDESAITRIVAPEGVSVAIARDLFNKPQTIIRSGNGKSATRSYVYDAHERLCKTIEPETGATVQHYDAADNVAWRASGLSLLSTSDCGTASVLAAKKTSFYYDGLNRLTTTTYGDGSASIFRTYTANGLPETIRSGAATWTYTYNKRRLIELERLDYGRAYTIARRYDGNGSLRQLQYPVDYLTLSLNPNALGEPRQIGAYASLITYHPNGALATFKYGNGITHTLTQNRRGLPEQSTDDYGVLNDRYTYDANANVAGIADLVPPNVTNRTMDYDGLDRLKTVSAPNLWGNASYEYDALDNLTSTTITGGGTARNSIHSYDASKNRLDSITGGPAQYNFAYGYDTQGNIIKRGAQEYVFDLGNRMTSATGKGSYVYDGLGRRVSAVGVDGVNRVQVYSQDGKLMYAGPTGSTGTKYIYLHNHLIAEVGGAGTQYDHTDGLGSPVAITNAARTIVSRTRYEPYGATAQGATPALGFAGHVSAPDLGLVYMQQRYYDPIAGRMLSIDPVVTDANTGGSFNRYAYGNNSPYRYIDPDGRDARDEQIKEDLERTRRNACGGGAYCGGGASSTGGANSSTGSSSPQNSGTSGTGPNARGTYGVDIAAGELETEGFVLVGREVTAWIPGATNTRRYDLVVQNPTSGLVFGVEIKTSLFDTFKLNPQQVAFDVRAIQVGAQTTLGVTVNSIMYRGVSFGSGPAAAWNTIKLAAALKAAGVPFHTTKSPLP